MATASLDEVRNLLSRIGIDDTAKFWRATGRIAKHSPVVGNYADLEPTYAAMAGNDLFRVIRLELIQVSFIKHTIQKVAHAVRLAMIFRNDFIDIFQRSAGILAGGSQASSLPIQPQVLHKLSYLPQALFIILNPIMRHSGNFVMRAR